MFSNIYLPWRLYKYWPALTMLIGVGYGLAGMPLVAGAMIIYAGWIWRQRLSR